MESATLLQCPCGEVLESSAVTCVTCGRALRASPVRPVARILGGKWRLEKKIGSGGMGMVWLATELGLDRQVAVKVLHPALGEEPVFLQRLEREARVLARLDHPSLVPLFAFASDAGVPFLVMKYIEGQALDRRLKERRAGFPLLELLDLTEQIGGALAYLHSRGIVHRDVKPANIIATAQGRYVLLDLGIARIPHALAQRLTTPGELLGTGKYMAPEQVRGDDVDHRADLYAFAMSLWELATGAHPLSRDGNEALVQQLTLVPPLAHQVSKNLPEAFGRELDRALQKDVEARHDDVPTFVESIRRALGASAQTRTEPTEKVGPSQS